MIATKEDIQHMRHGGSILAKVLELLGEATIPGATPLALDALARETVEKHSAKAAFLGFNNFPAAVCVSKNNQVVHGIPDDTPFEEGDIVSFDFGVLYKGLYTDAARTVIVGKPKNATHERLVDVCRKAFYRGMKVIHDGVKTGDIGHAIQTYVESEGFGVVRSLVGHGVGKELHEDPRIPNFGVPGTGEVLSEGMTVAIEPMITLGDYHVKTAPDGWTVVTGDSSMAAHFEQTILITKSGYDILTEV